MIQQTLDYTPCDPRVSPQEAPRLAGQCQQILDLLRKGPATNRELAKISLKYTSRVSDLRKAGYAVEVIDRCRSTGITTYSLKEPS